MLVPVQAAQTSQAQPSPKRPPSSPARTALLSACIAALISATWPTLQLVTARRAGRRAAGRLATRPRVEASWATATHGRLFWALAAGVSMAPPSPRSPCPSPPATSPHAAHPSQRSRSSPQSRRGRWRQPSQATWHARLHWTQRPAARHRPSLATAVRRRPHPPQRSHRAPPSHASRPSTPPPAAPPSRCVQPRRQCRLSV